MLPFLSGLRFSNSFHLMKTPSILACFQGKELVTGWREITALFHFEDLNDRMEEKKGNRLLLAINKKKNS